jgi:23S rRNA U2552 (ribose-2'-O)-methylase RlmE/FtsJ
LFAAPRAEKSQTYQRRVESEKPYEQRRAEIQEIRARSDAKLKALMEKLQIAKDEPPRS